MRVLLKSGFRFFISIRCLWWAILFCGRTGDLGAANATQFGVLKSEDFFQSDNGAPVSQGFDAFWFQAFATASAKGNVIGASVRLPDGTDKTLTLGPTGVELDFAESFDNRITLDLSYPSGDYAFRLDTASDGLKLITLNLPENFYPNPPRLADYTAAQGIKADADFALAWEPFVEGTTNDFVELRILDDAGTVVFATADFPGKPGALDGLATLQIIPAHKLQFGATYRGFLIFARLLTRNTASYPGALAVAGFSRQTEFTIQTAGTPGQTNAQFTLNLTFLADAGEFGAALSPSLTLPIHLGQCSYVTLLVQNEIDYPPKAAVTFSGPAGTTLTNAAAEFSYSRSGGVAYEAPCLADLPATLAGAWTIYYNDYPLAFSVPAPQVDTRLVVPVPTVGVTSNLLQSVRWAFHDAQGNALPSAPNFATNVFVEMYNISGFLVWSSTNLPPTTTFLELTNAVKWSEVWRFNLDYQDTLGNLYIVSFYHSPPPPLEILDSLLAKGSLATPYRVQLIASNGVPPYVWSISNGKLPAGLTLDSINGVISGSPEVKGTFHFLARVDDQAREWDAEQFQLVIGANGPAFIVEQPTGGSVDQGDFTFFEVMADGIEPLSYQWEFNGTNIAGETNATFYLFNVTTNQAGDYTVVVTNSLGQVTSQVARLSVKVPPVITTQPHSQSVPVGTNVTFRVDALSAPPLFYQWRLNGEIIEDATNSFLTIANVQNFNAGDYSVIVAGPEGAVRSDDAELRLLIEPLAFTNQFGNRTRVQTLSGSGGGSNAGANKEPGEPRHAGSPGGNSVWITWVAPADGIALFDTRGSSFDTVLAVYTGTSLRTLTEVASDDDSGDFFSSLVRFNAAAGTEYQIAIDGFNQNEGEIVLTWNLRLTNSRLPVILQQPQDRIVAAGATAIFSVVATNVPPVTSPLTYRWLFNGSDVNGGTNSTLSVPNVREADLGYYIVEISNDAESVLSEHVVLQINISEGNTVNELISTEDKFANLLNAIANSPLQTARVNPRGIRRSGGGLARGFTGTQIFSTAGSTSEAGEPNHCGVAGGASQWFVYRAEVDGRLTVSTEGSDFDTVLAIYTGPGDTFATLREVACDNDSGTNGRTSLVQFPATAGTIYFIAVDGVRGATGNARLNYNLTGPSRVRAERTKTGQFLVQVSGQPLRNYTVEASTNFQQWLPLLTTNAPAGTIEFKDLSAPSFQQRFYRAVATP